MRRIADKIGQTYAAESVARYDNSPQRRQADVELRHARDMADFILRKRARPATHDGDVCMLWEGTEKIGELVPRNG